ncbi:hypothetical protein, partial [Klebsiella pneumoniae]|uniref:hypothetical protein n=1 Tax=Klebsiella pneumoniae TaxID=573 RepID=UPI0025A26E40
VSGKAVDQGATMDHERSGVRHERGVRNADRVTHDRRSGAASDRGGEPEEGEPGKSAAIRHVRHV